MRVTAAHSARFAASSSLRAGTSRSDVGASYHQLTAAIRNWSSRRSYCTSYAFRKSLCLGVGTPSDTKSWSSRAHSRKAFRTKNAWFESYGKSRMVETRDAKESTTDSIL